MVACLLCLEINKDIFDCIKVNSPRWQELEIEKTIEKHFWASNITQPDSWICLSCWREVDSFHKFYLRIEEAHVNFGKIKVEDGAVSVECKEELTIPKLNIKENEEEWNKGSMALCFLEPEILIDQSREPDLTEREILIDPPSIHDLVDDKQSAFEEPLDELDLDNIPLKQSIKRLRIQNDVANEDPLEKPTKKKKSRKKVCSEVKLTEDNKSEDLKVKLEPMDFNDNLNSESINHKDNDTSGVNSQPNKDSSETPEIKKNQGCNKQRISREENDRFITQHIKEMSCDLCKEQFENFPALQKHFTTTHKQRGYVVCCGRKFFDRTRLVDHLHRHLNPDHFKCNECGKVMSDRLTFDNHMLRVHRADEVVRQHCCDVCGKSFIKASVLKLHKLTHLPEEEKKYPCEDCGKNYGSAYILNQHKQAVHLRRFVKICYLCGKAINSSAEFKVHMNKHEGIPLPIVNCDVCGVRLSCERSLKIHKESQHPVGGKQDHPCPLCDKISPSVRALKKHINTMHVRGFDHKCTMCDKAFRRAEALKEHMASHTGTPLYMCPWCPKTFNSNGNMHSHRKNKHPKEYLELKLQRYN